MCTEVLNGYEFSGGKFVKTTLNYNDPDPTKPYAFGEPISVYGARVMMKNYYNLLVSSLGTPAAKAENIGFTFGKEALMEILSQEDCVGIKFYIGQRTAADCPTGYSGNWPGKTLVAIGIRNDTNRTEIGADTDYIARGIDGVVNPPFGNTQPGMVMEVVPPFTMNNIP